MADYDYTELARYAYGREYSADVARRLMYGSRMTLELLEKEGIMNIKDTDMLGEIESKQQELRKELQRFYDQRREYNKLISEDGRRERLHEVIMEAAGKMNAEIGTLYPDDIIRMYRTCRCENEAVVVFSDWHYGMKTKNVFNEYDTEICKERVRNTVNEMTDRIAFHECSRAHVFILGDLFHGAVHVSARVASEELVCEQIMHVSEILARSINEIASCVDEVIVYMTYGNHARTVQTKKDNIHEDNMERIIGWWLEERFKETDRVKVVPIEPNGFITAEVCGYGFCATHGDLDDIRQSPRLLATLFHKKYNKDVNYVLLGDKHHRESFNELGITSMICGSLCGTDEYANGKRLYSEPSQLLLIVNEECGVDAEYRITCK